MQKRIFKKIVFFICFVGIGIFTQSSNFLSAQILQQNNQVTTSQQHKVEITKFDQVSPYIRVRNNQYVLKFDNNVVIDSNFRQSIIEAIMKTNEYVFLNHININETSKTGTQRIIETRRAGVTRLQVNWWGLNIWLSKNDINNIISRGSASAAGGLLGTILPGIGNAAGAIAGSVIGGFIGDHIPHVNSGINVHYNWIRGIDYFKWQ